MTTTDENNNTTEYTYNQRGFLIQIQDPLNGITAFDYDRAGRKTVQITSKNYNGALSTDQMNRTEYIYDTMDRPKKETQKYIDSVTGEWQNYVSKAYEYDAQGNLSKELDALGYSTQYTYDFNGKILTTLDPVSQERFLPFTTQYTYDALGRKITETNATGIITEYTYDNAGNLLTIEKDGHNLQTNTYDLTGNLLSQTDANGNTSEYTYNALGKLRQAQYPEDTTIDTQTIIYQYDEMGNLKKQQSSQNKLDLFQYDNEGRILSRIQQKTDGTQVVTTAYKYDPKGNKRFETDGNGTTTECTYDSLDRLLTITTAGKTTTNTYDPNNNLLTQTDWRGNTYNYIYDPLNRLIEKLDPEGKRIEKLVYNNNHVQIESLDALNNKTTFTYDKNNRLLKTTDPMGYSTSQTYDNLGNIITKTDGKGNVTRYAYDQFNRLLTVTNALNEITTYTYDLNGNLLTQQDEKGNLTTYRYNVANKAKEKIDPLNLSESYTYYPDGNLKTKTDRNGQTTTYTYDCHGRLTQESIGTETISYTYDHNGNQLTITDSTGTTTRTYDALNRVTSKTVPHIGTATYQYDLTNSLPEGYVAELTTDPKGNTTQKTYDCAGRLQAVTAAGATTIYTYYDNGNRASLLYANGAKEEYEYYNNNLLWKLINKNTDGTVMDTYTYTYDQAGNQTGKHEIINNITKGTTTYTYDQLNRLSTVEEPNGKLTTYTYDQVGNRATETISANGQTIENVYAYNAQNRLQSVTTTDGTVTSITTYTYDDNGNQLTVTTDGQIIANNTYDLRNQLIQTVSGNSTVVNTYNGEGLRVAKEVDGVKTQYLYEYDKIILEVDEQNNVVARNVYGLNLLQRTVGDESYYYLYNGHADVTALIDVETGAVVGTYYYDAFGNILEQTGEVNNSITYAGYQYDEETGLYYLNARMYDPKIARFLQEDTYMGDPRDPLSLNLYTYCANNPLVYYDPTGHSAVNAVKSSNQHKYLSYMKDNDPNEGNRIWAAHQLASQSYYIDPSEPNKVYTYDEVMAAQNSKSSLSGTTGLSPKEKTEALKGETKENNKLNLKKYSNIEDSAFQVYSAWNETNPEKRISQISNPYVSSFWGTEFVMRLSYLDSKGVDIKNLSIEQLDNIYAQEHEIKEGQSILGVTITLGMYGWTGIYALGNNAQKQQLNSGNKQKVVNTTNNVTKGTSKIDLNLKPNVSNEKLKNIVNDLYKGQGGSNTIGNGTTMDAVRNEINTGLPTHGKFHTQKLNDYLNALQRRLRAGDLNNYDKSVVNALIEDINNALKGQ